MKRKLFNQTGESNKFWSITIQENTQIIKWGKIGTNGRESIKHFPSAEKCLKESNKLIAQKLKKGYKERFQGEVIPEKEGMTAEEKADHFFWTAIATSNKATSDHWSAYDIEEHLENLTLLLSKYGKQKMILFEKHLLQKLNELYIAPIAELSIILECEFKEINGEIIFDDYISTDGFIYFRCWLLLKGKEFFEDIKKDINAFVSGEYSFNIGDIWAEGLLYVADEAYSYEHENEEISMIRDAVSELFPNAIHYDSGRNKMDRPIKKGTVLHKTYTNLVNDICALRK